MRMLRALTPLLCLLAGPLSATAQGKAQAAPGETVIAAVQLRMPKGWHTYWRNAGDSGDRIKIQWQLPQGMTAGEIQWPPPEKLTEEGLTTYVYYNEVQLVVPLKLAPNLSPGPLQLKAAVSWLECEKICVP